jgi:SOS response regulatory protein OraA/RecX
MLQRRGYSYAVASSAVRDIVGELALEADEDRFHGGLG